MIDFSLYGKCEICHKNKLFIRKRMVKIQVGEIKSQKKMCTECHKTVLKMLNGDVKL